MIYIGDNKEILKGFPDNTFHACITDPPYGISFMDNKWDYDVPDVETWREVLRVLRPGGFLVCFCGTRTQHRMAVNIEDAGFNIRDIIAWLYGQGFPKSMNISKAIDRKLGAEREVIGQTKGRGSNSGSGCYNWNSEKDEKDRTVYDMTLPASEQAKKWEGWGTQLKPAMEMISLAQKPIEGTFAENVMKWGVGGLNIGGCLIPLCEGEVIPINKLESWSGFGQVEKPYYEQVTNEDGRFPENVILDEQAGELLGDPSRFFYCAKTSKEERNAGIENDHPTVKPITLMRYLARLVCPVGGNIVDPYSGSGSTGCGAVMEQMGYTGIDLSGHYGNISEVRIAYWDQVGKMERSQMRLFR